MRILVLLVVAAAVAAGSGYYIYAGSRGPAQQPVEAVAETPQRTVFVPLRDLAAGSILKPEHLGRMPVEKGATTPEMILADAAGEAALVGSVARQPLPKGLPIARSAVVQPGDRGFLAAVLPQGKRAISIPITEVAGVSGLILPGDRVDIILTYALAGAAIDATRDVRASETVLTNIRVLALDQRLGQTRTGTDGAPLADAPPIARTATLQVSPREAEMITLATSLGDLSLVLNSVHDGGDIEEPSPAAPEAAQARRMTLDSDVTSLLQRTAQDDADAPAPLAERRLSIQVVRGTSRGAVEIGERLSVAAVDPPADALED